MSILIASQSDDVHALSVRTALLAKGFRDCFLVQADQISGREMVSMHVGNSGTHGTVLDFEGRSVPIGEARVLWVRRLSPAQRTASDGEENSSQELIDNDCAGAISALFDTCFSGTWISKTSPTMEASNKIYQLNVARACGFRVPDTLITQNKHEVVEFVEKHDGKVIVKPVVGMTSRFLLTRILERPETISIDAYRQCPAIYQEYIPGTRHIRLNCFGERSFAAVIETIETDWRPNLSVPVSVWRVPDSVHTLVRRVLDALQLAMGIIDIKESPEGELVWFEVNPQGQFLFLEPLTGLKLSQHFADYLISEWHKTGSDRKRQPFCNGENAIAS